MQIIHLKEALPDEDVERLIGSLLDDSAYDTLITYDCDVYTPEGTPLLKFRKGVIPQALCAATFPIWDQAATPTDNRGYAAGVPEIGEDGKLKGLRKEHGKVISGKPGATRLKFYKQDGTIAKKTVAKTVNSGIVGYMDGNPRFPYCRLTAFNLAHAEQFAACMPLIQLVDSKFKELMPERHAAQMRYHERTHPDFKLPGTSFTTLTVNANFRTACHTDQGDLKEGFGVMTAMRAGHYRGGYLIFPKYRIAVDMQTTDLICADVHQVHGNAPIIGIPGTYKRISLVFYYREKIISCKSAEEERRKAMSTTEAHYRKDLPEPTLL